MTANDNTIRLPATAKPSASPSADTGELYHKTGTKAVYWLDEDGTDYDLTAGAAGAIVTSGSGNPASAPASIGDIYVDTNNTPHRVMIATGTAATTDYKIVHGSRTSYTMDEATAYTTSNTSFSDVDGTNLSLTIVTNGGDVLVGFTGNFQVTALSDYVYFNVYESVAAADVVGDDGLVFGRGTTSGGVHRAPIAFTYPVTGLSAGSHTFKLRWKVDSGTTATLYAGEGATDRDVHGNFWVKEI